MHVSCRSRRSPNNARSCCNYYYASHAAASADFIRGLHMFMRHARYARRNPVDLRNKVVRVGLTNNVDSTGAHIKCSPYSPILPTPLCPTSIPPSKLCWRPREVASDLVQEEALACAALTLLDQACAPGNRLAAAVANKKIPAVMVFDGAEWVTRGESKTLRS